MRLTVREARRLAAGVMMALGCDAADASLISDHLIDCELRGLSYGGLARAISIAERIERHGDRRRQISILHETPVSARLDGGDRIGYIVAHRATTVAIEKTEDPGSRLSAPATPGTRARFPIMRRWLPLAGW